MAPGLACPVVALGGVPAGGGAVVDAPPALPPAAAGPAACASPIEPESASALTNAIVASFMGYSLVLLSGNNPKGARDVPAPLNEHHVCSSQSGGNYLASVGRTFIRHKFQMRSITAKLVWSAFTPSPGVR